MHFYLMQIIEKVQIKGEEFVSLNKNSFQNIITKGNFKPHEDTYYEFSIENTDNYIWFFFDYGKTNPRDGELTNIKTGEKRDNPREINEVEETEQFFVLYNYESLLLYISCQNKKGIFTKFLKEKLNSKFEIKKIQINKKEFIETLQEISEIKFTNIKDLFNQNNKYRKALKDLTGIDAPDEFTIHAKYSQGTINSLKSFFCKLDNNDLVIKGTDASGFEKIYNDETFTKKISIDVSKNENGKYDSDVVKQKLISELEKLISELGIK